MKNLLLLFILLTSAIVNTSAQSDNCSTATPITLNASGAGCVNGTTVNGTLDNITTSCNASSVNFVWYQFTSTGTNNTITLTPGTLQNAVMYTDETACNDGSIDFCNNGTGTSVVTILDAQPVGTTIRIAIATTTNNQGTFQLCVNSFTPTNPAAGDDCSNAIPYCNSSTNLTVNTSTFTGSGNKPSCFIGPGSAPSQDMYITFTVTQNGTIAWTGNPSTNNTEFDWALYNTTSGCPGSEIDCNYNYDGASGGNFGMAGTVDNGEFNATINGVAGQTYTIRINNYSANGSSFVFSWQGTALIAPVVNFNINPSTVTCAASVTVNTTNTSAGVPTWTFGNGNTYTGTTPPSQTYTTPGTYAITATIGGACPATLTKYVKLYGPLAATLSSTATTCPLSCNGTASVATVSGGDGVYAYSWSNGGTTSSISNLCAGTYTVTISNAACGTSITQSVTVSPGAGPTITASASPTTICTGASSTLSANGGVNYTWSPNTNLSATSGASVTASPTSTTTYTVTGTNAGGCTNIATVVLTVNPLPTITVNNATICTGNNATLTANGGTSYSWTASGSLSGTSGSPVAASPTATTTYTVTGTNANSCLKTATSIVTVNPLPTITVNSPSMCAGTSTTLTAGGGTTYTWSPGTNLSATTGGSVTANPVSTTTYTVTGTNGNGCINTATSIVTVNPIPIANAGADISICPSTSGTIGAASTAGYTYTWSPSATLSSATVSNPTASPSATTTYSVSVTANGCTSTDGVIVSIGSLIPSAGTDVAICSGGSTSLNATGGTAYTWSPATGLSSTSVGNPTASPSSTTTYTVTATQAGCTGTDQVIVTVNPLPTTNAGADISFCSGSTGNLGAATVAGNTYSWNPTTGLSGSNISNPTVTLSNTTTIAQIFTYTVTMTGTGGCTTTDQVVVTVNPIPVANAGADISYCTGSSGTIGTAAVGGVSYTWTPSTGLSSATSSNPTVTLTNGGASQTTTTYTVTASASGCSSTDQVVVAVNPLPTANAGADISFCSGSTGNLGSTTVAGETYSWSPSTGLSSATVSNPTVTLTNAGTTSITSTYTLTVISASGCVKTDIAIVTVNPIPVANAGADVGYCTGSSGTFGTTFTVGYTYAWSPSTGLSSTTVSNPTVTVTNASGNPLTSTYTVSVSANGCSSTDNVILTVYSSPVADAGTDVSICSGSSASVGVAAAAGYTYTWSPATGLSDPTISNPSITTTNSGTTPITTTYTLTASITGCNSTDVVIVTVNPIPVANAGADVSYCSGSSGTFGVASIAGYSYLWTPSTGLSSTTVSNPTVTVTNASSTPLTSTYTLSVSAYGCSSSDQAVLTVYSMPVADAGTDVNICSGALASVGATSSAGYTYTWSPATGLNDPTISNPSITTINSGTTPITTTYTLTASITGCNSTDVVIVTVNPIPFANAGADVSYCSGSSGTFGVASTAGYSYTWTPSTGLSSATVSNPTVTVTNTSSTPLTSTYTLSVSANGCSSSDQAVLTVYSMPVADAGADVNICSGASASVGSASSAGYSYTWSPSAGLSDPTISNPSITLTNSGTTPITTTFTVTASITGCNSTDEVIVTVNPIPVSDAGSDITFCSGASGSLGAASTAGFTYTWSPSTGLSSSISSNPTVTLTNLTSSPVASTFTVTTTAAGGCTSTDDVIVTVNPIPVSDAGADIKICSGSTGNLGSASSAGSTYSWSPSTGLSSGSVSNPTVTLTNSTTGNMASTYTVTTTANGCTSTDLVVVTVPAPIAAVTGHTDPKCFGGSDGQVGVIATGGILPYAYVWSGGLGTASFATNVSAGSYTVTITDSLGCTFTTPAEVVGQPTAITSSITSTSAYCNQANGTATVTPTGGTGTFTYNWNCSSSIANLASGLTPGTCTVTFTDANQCTGTNSIVIGNISGPSVTISSTTSATCNGSADGTITASPSGGTGTLLYSWNTTPIQNTATASGLGMGSYCVTVTDSAGCSSTVCGNITEPTAVSVAGSSDVTICRGKTTQLNATASGGNGSPYSYSWSPSASLNSDNIQNPVSTPTAVTTYNVTATDALGCISTTDQVIVGLFPVLNVSADFDATICVGQSVNISATSGGGNGGPYTITWSPASGLSSTSGTSITANPATTTTYTATVNDGCTVTPARDTVIITVNPLPVVTFTPIDAAGCYPVEVNFTNNTANSALCDWAFGDGTTSNASCTPIHTYDTPGSYDVTLTVTDINNCTNTATVTNAVTVYDHPTADFTMSPQPTTIVNPTINFKDSSSADVTNWNWYFEDLDTLAIQNPSYTFPDSGNYAVQLYVMNQYGCMDSITKLVRIDPEMLIYIPNAFSPNGDGRNDKFGPVGVNIEKETFEMWIFDRWGNQVFYSADPEKLWDGKSNGGSDASQEDVYVWKIKIYPKDNTQQMFNKVGTVTLLK